MGFKNSKLETDGRRALRSFTWDIPVVDGNVLDETTI